MSSSSLTHVLARIAELRPVLPKPTASGPCHDPSSGIAHSHPDRHHHDSMFFSPYGRAYEYTHGSHHEFGHGSGIRSQPLNNDSKEESFTDSPNTLPSWTAFADAASLPSTCGCGETCSCPGCAQHGSATAGSFQTADAFNTCTNPVSCHACLDYTVMSIPDTLPPDTALSIFDQPSQFIDDWLRQVSDVPTSISPPSGFGTSLAVNVESGFVQPPWETYQLPDNPELEQVPDVIPDEGVIPCICAPEQCMCGGLRGDCGQMIGSAGLVFPITGKRMSCPGINLLDVPAFSDLPSGAGTDPQGFLTAPLLPRSRCSSGSSYSSHNLERFLAGRRSDDTSTFRISTRDYFSNDLSIASSQPDFSPTHSEHDGGAIYQVSNPDSERSYEDLFSRYDPTLDGAAYA